ncbi:MAG: hypothetical protein HN712_03280 [Gemmatimonadetes bacterium]|jgi:hypothetical protein|nr:hypothetical protein [Gemmatimonadota bacterium]MBT7859301.1 hypothetical protein [Gemmatimonadota bacterium]
MSTTAPILAADGTSVPAGDIERLRRLAARKAEIATDPINLERREMWLRHDAGTGSRPMVLAEIGGVRDCARAVIDTDLTCEHDWARGLERGLRSQIYQFDILQDDHVVEPRQCVSWQARTSDYGVEVVQHHPDFEGSLGARRWDPPLTDLPADLDRLRPRTFSVDRASTHAEVERLEAAIGDLLDIEIRGGFWWTLGMTWTAIELIGLEGLMLAMYDAPAALHGLMGFLRDDAIAYARWLEAEELLCLNNEDDYIGSGSMGYTHELPDSRHTDSGHTGADHTGPVRTVDQWALLESQETVGVSPELFGEFILPYQLDVARLFGRIYYGCCEPVDSRIHLLRQLPNLARISVSPWADEAAMADACGTQIVYSRKQNPTLISTEVFDEAAIRADLLTTLETAADCRVELVMKDVHTLSEQPERLPRWVALAREAIDTIHG